jgi:conjugative transfer region lipoprotein (TIGR03751 family)
MQQTWTERSGRRMLAATALAVVATLTGCATNTEDLLSHDSSTMRDIWDKSAGAGASDGAANRQLLDVRLILRRPLAVPQTQGPGRPASVVPDPVDLAPYTRTAQSEIQRQFFRLPNPDLVMYVFPHLAGTEPVPVPGYSTVFSFYQRVQYAMPGERVEDY